ncbi:Uncharacterised protein [uncultured archaeon]|nr:Uncharacterised protein [uncultured archaeon]
MTPAYGVKNRTSDARYPISQRAVPSTAVSYCSPQKPDFLPKIDRALNFLIEEALLRDLFWCHSFDVRLVKIFIEAHKNKIVALGSYVLVCIIKV